MSNDYFRFKQFVIHQGNAAMKVGTDSVLLGAWTNIAGCKNILDVGTGTGLIMLMLAQRSNANILGIEIDNSAFLQAGENISLTKWENRCKVVHISLQEFCKSSNYTFDLIVSNPPYFDNSLKSPSKERTLSRHTDSLSYDELFESSAELLSELGKLSIIVPSNKLAELIKIAGLNTLYVSRITKVIPVTGKSHKRVLLEFCKTEMTPSETQIVIENGKRHNYTEDYKLLTKDFYLNF